MPPEAAVVQAVILDRHGEAALARYESWPARNRPTLQNALKLEPEVIVQSPSSVLLNDEGGSAHDRATIALGAGRFILSQPGTHKDAPAGAGRAPDRGGGAR